MFQPCRLTLARRLAAEWEMGTATEPSTGSSTPAKCETTVVIRTLLQRRDGRDTSTSLERMSPFLALVAERSGDIISARNRVRIYSLEQASYIQAID